MSGKAKPVNRLIADFAASENAKNDKKNVKLRKMENTLYASGFGLILLGAWQVFEVIFRLSLDFENTKTMFMDFYGYFGVTEYEGISENFVVAVIMVSIVVFSLLTLFFQLWVGRMAMQEAKRKKVRRFYLVLAVLLVINSLAVLNSDVQNMTSMVKSFDIFQVFSQSVFDVLMFVTSFLLLYHGIMVKIYRITIAKSEKKEKEGR